MIFYGDSGSPISGSQNKQRVMYIITTNQKDLNPPISKRNLTRTTIFRFASCPQGKVFYRILHIITTLKWK
jgi:hypothetical protein